MVEVLRRLRTATGPVHHTLVVAPRHVLKRYIEVLIELKLPWEECAAVTDAADECLCERARHLVSCGFSRVYISSGDHYFGCLTEAVQITIVVPRGQSV